MSSVRSVFYQISGKGKWTLPGRSSSKRCMPARLCIDKDNNVFYIQVIFKPDPVKHVKIAPSHRVKLAPDNIGQISHYQGQLKVSFSKSNGLFILFEPENKEILEITIEILKTLERGLTPVLLDGKVTVSEETGQNADHLTDSVSISPQKILPNMVSRSPLREHHKKPLTPVKRHLQKIEDLSQSNERFKPKKCVLQPNRQRLQSVKKEVSKKANYAPLELASPNSEAGRPNKVVQGSKTSKNVTFKNDCSTSDQSREERTNGKSDSLFPDDIWSVFEKTPEKTPSKKVPLKQENTSRFDVSPSDLTVSQIKKESPKISAKRSGWLNADARSKGEGNKENNATHLHASPQRKKQLNEVTPIRNKSSGIKSFYNSASRNSISMLPMRYSAKKASPVKKKIGFLSNPFGNTSPPITDSSKKPKADLVNDFLSQSEPTSTGFNNIGNSCYMNSILQSLLCLVPFVQDLGNNEILKLANRSSLYRCLYELYLCKDEKVILGTTNSRKEQSLKNLKDAISEPEMVDRFGGFRQNDAHEFMNACLDQIKEEVKKIIVNQAKQGSTPNKSNVENIQAELCPVSRNFEGRYRKYIKCKGCHDVGTKDELFYHVSLNIPQTDKSPNTGFKLRELLRLFFQQEELERKCEKCEHSHATQTFKIETLPRVMIFHVLRNRFHRTSGKQEKRFDKITSDRYVDIHQYCNQDVKGPIPFTVKHIRSPLSRKHDSETPSNELDDFVATKPRRRLDMSGCDSPNTSKSSRMNGSWTRTSTPTKEVATGVSLGSKELSNMSMEEQIELATRESLRASMSEEEMIRVAQMESLGLTQMEDGILPDEDFPMCDPISDDDLRKIDAQIKDNSHSGEQIVPCRTSQGKTVDISEGFRKRATSEDSITNGSLSGLNVSAKRSKLQSSEETTREAGNNSENERLQRDLEESKITSRLQNDEDWQLSEAKKRSLSETAPCLEKIQTNSTHQYRLLSIVNHVGQSNTCGHYSSDVFNLKSEQWVRCSDMDLKKVDEHSVRYSNSGEAYIYFYMHKSLTDQLLANKDRKG